MSHAENLIAGYDIATPHITSIDHKLGLHQNKSTLILNESGNNLDADVPAEQKEEKQEPDEVIIEDKDAGSKAS